MEVGSSEQPTSMVSAVESAPSNDEEHTTHEVYLETAADNMLTSSAATDVLRDTVEHAACQSDAACTDGTARQSEASQLDSKASHDASYKDTTTAGSTKDDSKASRDASYILPSEGTAVDVTGSKQDGVNIVGTQTDDASRGSSSHFQATLQSTESDWPPGQGENLESRKEQVKPEEALDNSSGGNQTHSLGDEPSHDTSLARNSPSEYSNERCSAQVIGETFKSKENIVEVHSAMNTDGPDEALDALYVQSKEASITDIGVPTDVDKFEGKGTSAEVRADMNTVGPEDAQDASSTQSDKEAIMIEFVVSTDGSPTVCKAYNDLEGHVYCEGRTGGDDPIHTNANYGSNNKSEDTIVNPVETTREPMEESTVIVSENSDLNKQSHTLHTGNDPPVSTLLIVESNKVTCDAEIVCASRLESSSIEAETVGIQDSAVTDFEGTKGTGDLGHKTDSPLRDDVHDTPCSTIGLVCEKEPTEALTAGSHSEAPNLLAAVEQTRETTVANQEEIIDAVVFMDACKAEPDGDCTVAKGAEQTVEIVHSVEKQSAVLEHVERQTKQTMICGSTLNESPQAAGLEEDCSVLKHGGPTASSELLAVAPNPIGETSVIQAEPEATNSDGYCTTEVGSALSETVMGLEPNKETAVPMQEDIGEANDTSNNCEARNNSGIHAFGEVSMEMQSSEFKEVSSIQSGAANLSTQTPALPDETGQTNMASAAELVPTNDDEHMQGIFITCISHRSCEESSTPCAVIFSVNSNNGLHLCMFFLLLFSGTEVNSEQQIKMVSPAESAPANDEHVQGTDFKFLTHLCPHTPALQFVSDRIVHPLLLFF